MECSRLDVEKLEEVLGNLIKVKGLREENNIARAKEIIDVSANLLWEVIEKLLPLGNQRLELIIMDLYDLEADSSIFEVNNHAK